MERAQLKDTDELAALVRAAQAGDEAALPRLIEATERRLFRFLLFLSTDPALANDLCQDVYLYVFENLGKIEEPRAFLGWLFRIAKSRFLDHVKSPRNKPHAGEAALDGLEAGCSPELREQVLQVRRTMETLEPDQRLPLILVDIEGYSIREAAETIGITEAALNSRLKRARALFHKRYFGG